MTQSWTEAFSSGRIIMNNSGFQEICQKIMIRKKTCKWGKATCMYWNGWDRRVQIFPQFIENRDMSLLTLYNRVFPMEEGDLLPWEPAGSWNHCPTAALSPAQRQQRTAGGCRRLYIPSCAPFSFASPQENTEGSTTCYFSPPSLVQLTHQCNPTPGWLQGIQGQKPFRIWTEANELGIANSPNMDNCCSEVMLNCSTWGNCQVPRIFPQTIQV